MHYPLKVLENGLMLGLPSETKIQADEVKFLEKRLPRSVRWLRVSVGELALRLGTGRQCSRGRGRTGASHWAHPGAHPLLRQAAVWRECVVAGGRSLRLLRRVPLGLVGRAARDGAHQARREVGE